MDASDKTWTEVIFQNLVHHSRIVSGQHINGLARYTEPAQKHY
ncbi:hypothetical protein [Peribacillus muralis]|nr:hypothetical protein [Peribacillus muralis]